MTDERHAAENRAAIFDALLRLHLGLSEVHRQKLRDRGLDDVEIGRGGYASTPASRPERERVASALAPYLEAFGGCPGFYRDGGRWAMVYRPPGFFVPYRDEMGRVVGLQSRADELGGGGKYIWLSSNPEDEDERGRVKHPGGQSSGTPVHFAGRHLLDDASEVVVTEGALKADIIAHLLGAPVVAAAGVYNFGEGFAARLSGACPRLRRVALAFDSDWRSNLNIRRALEKMRAELAGAGFDVRLRVWDPTYKGLDDFLAARHLSHRTGVAA